MGRSRRLQSISESSVDSQSSADSQMGFTSLAPLKSRLNGVENIVYSTTLTFHLVAISAFRLYNMLLVV